MKKPSSSRLVAFRIISNYEKNPTENHLKNIIEKELSSSSLSMTDKRLVTEISYGVVRWKLYLNALIGEKAKISKKIRLIIYISLYQLVFLDKIPDHAVVNEAVILTKYADGKRASSFVNWFLRDFLRNEKEDTFQVKDIKNEPGRIAVTSSHPKWLVTKWIEQFGIEKTISICKSNNITEGLSVRVNSLKNKSTEDFEKIFQDNSILFRKSLLFDDVFIIKNPGSETVRYNIENGFLYIQDEASIAIGEIVSPLQGDRILDLCSAPGGKSLHLSAITSNKAFIYCIDKNFAKAKIIKENAKRYEAHSINIITADSMTFPESLRSDFDKVLLDAPCSGTGIIRHHPDIKWSRGKEDFKKFASVQLKLLQQASLVVKVKGEIIYSACTLEREECEDVIDAFLLNNKRFHILDISERVSKPLVSFVNSKGFFRTFPSDGIDGFFCTLLQKD